MKWPGEGETCDDAGAGPVNARGQIHVFFLTAAIRFGQRLSFTEKANTSVSGSER